TVLVKTIQRIEDLRTRQDEITGVPTGFAILDHITYGWQPSDLIVLAARPSVGKTAFALNLARNAALHPTKPTVVGFFSLEMSAGQLVQRILSAESEIWLEKIARGRLEEHEMKQLYKKGIERLASAPIHIDDSAALNIFELRAKCRRLKNKHNVGLIIIDYLQLMSGAGENRNSNREQEISRISRDLKGLAKELSIPIIALSQLSREVEKRKEGNKMPQLSDLRECVIGDTLVCLTNGKRVPIKMLVGQNAEVWTLDSDHKITTSTTELIWPVGIKKIFEIKLASGRTLKATAEHKILCFAGWKTISEIQTGERVAVTRYIPEPSITTRVSKHKLILLAHLIGDGSYLSHQPLRYTTASEENSDIVKTSAEMEFNTIVNRHEYKGTWHQLVFSGNGNRWNPKGLNKWLRDIGVYNQRSFEKKIPDFIFCLPTEDICLFLQHLWATDGTIYTKKGGGKIATRVAFSTNSVGLANDVSALLLRVNIVARIRVVQQAEYKPMYSVDISGTENQLLFIKKVGAFGPKEKQLDDLKNVLKERITNTNVDTLPQEIFVRVKERMKLRGISQRKMASLRGTSYGGSSHFKFSPTRETINEYCTILEDDEIKKIASNDIFWDKVVSVTPCGEEEVFDLTVSNTHNWIANEGIVTHNSGAIEQDADMVMFLYRPEYYDITSNELGESNKGETHVRIAKHRNGQLDTIKLKALLHIQKFVEDDGDDFSNKLPQGGSWKPVKDIDGDGAKLYIQKGSKMNDGEFDEEAPF
ncbi:MAG: AAA family ATPase, partial [Bacteroidota bacterium]|nr:AAA family ATPase [Bacteroidota bacterium]